MEKLTKKFVSISSHNVPIKGNGEHKGGSELMFIARGVHWRIRRTTCNKKIGSNIFIVDKFCKTFTCKIEDFKIVKHVYM